MSDLLTLLQSKKENTCSLRLVFLAYKKLYEMIILWQEHKDSNDRTAIALDSLSCFLGLVDVSIQ